jgi:hypothetical protein
MNDIKLLIIPLLITVFLILISCTDGSQSEISYAFDIQPIFNDRCIGCHGNNEPSANLCLTNYDSLMLGDSNNGPVVNPNAKPRYSILYQKVAYSPPPFGLRMPMDGPLFLSSQKIDYIWQWIYDGAKDN